jgi:hypothetical protein
MNNKKVSTKKVSTKKVSTKKVSTKKISTKKISTKKVSTKKTLINKSNIIKGIGAIGATALLGYGIYKGVQYQQIVTKPKTISNLFNNKEEAIEFAFNPTLKTSWNGDVGLGILFFREYLVKKYKNVCTTEKPILSLRFEVNFTNLTVFKVVDKNIVVETISIDDIPIFLKNLFDICKNNNFFVLPFTFATSSFNPMGHANILIYNKNKNIVEHYEPYGGSQFDDKYYNRLDQIFKQINIIYCNPTTTCPRLGPQINENSCPNLFFNIKTPGFCVIWSLWLADLRINNPNVNSKTLIETKLKEITGNNIGNLCVFIITYSQFIFNFSKKYNLIIESKSCITIDYEPINKNSFINFSINTYI